MNHINLQVTESQFELMIEALEFLETKCEHIEKTDLAENSTLSFLNKISGGTFEKYQKKHADKHESIKILTGKLYFDKRAMGPTRQEVNHDQASQS